MKGNVELLNFVYLAILKERLLRFEKNNIQKLKDFS